MTDSIFDVDNVESKEAEFGSAGTPDKDNDSLAGLSREEIDKKLKSLGHAQAHIKTLESETAQYRQELARLQEEMAHAKTIEELLARREEDSTNRTTPVDVDGLATKVKEEVFSTLTEREQVAKQQANLNASIEAVKKVHGEKYSEAVRNRASELNMTTKQMEDLAKSSPGAFQQLMNVQSNRMPAPTSSSTSSNVAPSESGEQLSSEYFMKVRRENRKLWDSSEFQRKYRQYLNDNVINKN